MTKVVAETRDYAELLVGTELPRSPSLWMNQTGERRERGPWGLRDENCCQVHCQQLRADCSGHAFLVCSGDPGRGLLCRFFFSCCCSLSSFFFR